MTSTKTSDEDRVPVIKLYETLIVSLPESLSDSLLESVNQHVAERLRGEDSISALIIEVSALEVFDSFVARVVRNLAQVSRLMGVDTVLSGLDHTMAVTLVEMGLEMEGVETVLNLEAAMEFVCPWLRRARRQFVAQGRDRKALELALLDRPRARAKLSDSPADHGRDEPSGIER
ncbi:MAG TPA: STAS domain-containing protein [Polyangiaceae bacterium]